MKLFRTIIAVVNLAVIANSSHSAIYVDKVDHPRKVVILEIEYLIIGKDVVRRKIKSKKY